MNVVQRMMGRAGAPAARASGFSTGLTLQTMFGGAFADSANTTAGKVVTVEKALGLPAVFSTIRAISDDVSQIPILTYERTGPGGQDRRRATEEPTWRLLHNRPNPIMSPRQFWWLVQSWVEGWGEAFIGKEYFPGTNVVKRLWPVHPDRVSYIDLVDGEKRFHITLRDGGTGIYTQADILHLWLISLDGIRGVSPISLCREAIGRGLALSEFSSRMMGDRAIPAGVIQMQKELKDPKARQRFRTEWEHLYKGSAQSHKIAILEEGATFQPITMPLVDAQFVEQQRLSLLECAQIFGMPVTRIGGSTGDSLTYKTLESDSIRYQRETLRPRTSTIEQELCADLSLHPPIGGRDVLYSEFEPSAMLSVDTLTRFKAYQVATGGKPWMTGSEVRQRENLDLDDRFDVVAPPAPKQLAPPAFDPSADAPDEGDDGSPKE